MLSSVSRMTGSRKGNGQNGDETDNSDYICTADWKRRVRTPQRPTNRRDDIILLAALPLLGAIGLWGISMQMGLVGGGSPRGYENIISARKAAEEERQKAAEQAKAKEEDPTKMASALPAEQSRSLAR